MEKENEKIAQINIDAIKKMNIYEKLSNVTNEIETVKKNLDVGTGKSKYKAVAEKDVLEAVKDIEYKYRIYSYPKERKVLDQQIFTKELEDKEGNIKEVNTYYSKIETIYCFVNIDNDEEKIEITSFSEGIDTGDKGFGKAMTYADKYALLKAYKIETGDDPDKEPSPTYENDITQLTLEEALNIIVDIGKYKNQNKTMYDVYKTDKNWLQYISSGDTPNQLAKKCMELFDAMPINQLKTILNSSKTAEKVILKKYEVKSIDDLTEEQIKEAIETLIEFKKKKESQISKSKENINNMLEEAEKEIRGN